MIHGIGIDIVNVARIKKMIEKYDERFLRKIFTKDEIAYSKKMRFPEIHFAVRFAAKEAFYKALRATQKDGVSWSEVGIINDKTGMPHMLLTGKSKEVVDSAGIKNILVSVSHEREMAVAQVILES